MQACVCHRRNRVKSLDLRYKSLHNADETLVFQSGRASPAINSRSVSPTPVIKSVSAPSTTSSTSQPPLQAAVAPQVSGQSKYFISANSCSVLHLSVF